MSRLLETYAKIINEAYDAADANVEARKAAEEAQAGPAAQGGSSKANMDLGACADALSLPGKVNSKLNSKQWALKRCLYPKFYWKHLPPLSRSTKCSVDSF